MTNDKSIDKQSYGRLFSGRIDLLWTFYKLYFYVSNVESRRANLL